MDMLQAMKVSGGGMLAQAARIKIASENIANADSVQSADGSGPYRAKQIFFKSVLNRQTGLTEVQVDRVQPDTNTPLRAVYMPSSDLADARGFVQYPNVDSTLENLNLREAQRSYEANLGAISAAREMASRTLDLIR